MASAEQRGKGEYPWSVKYRIGTKPDGKPDYTRDSGFRTEKEALNHGREQEADLRRGTWHDDRRGRITLDEYWAKWLTGYDTSDRNLATRTTHYNIHLKPRWGSTPIADIDPFDVDAFDKAKRTSLSTKYVNGIMELLRMLMDDAVFAGLLRTSPVRARRRQATKVASTVRVGMVTDIPTIQAIRGRLPEPDALMFLVVLFTGMRWGEAIGIRRSFLTLTAAKVGKAAHGQYVIDPKIGAVHEDTQGRRFFAWPKGHKGRTIELPPFLVELLLDYLGTFPADRDLLFVDRKGQPFHRGNYSRRRWRPACDGWPERKGKQGRASKPAVQAVAQDLVPHDLRHTHKTWLAEDGIEPVARDERLGHETPGMDGIYIHTTPAMRAKILVALQRRWDEHQAISAS